jgi:tripartite-type tricarboxylate transporter receptor subunit TctC
VPYKGGAASSADLAGGQVQLVITNLPEQVAYLKSGRTRALGVSTTKRSPAFPDVPSISDTVPGYDVTVWYGLCGPGGMPRPLVEKINADLVKAVSSPETRKRLMDAGIEPSANTADQFSSFVKDEVAKWAKVIKEAGIAAE